jgi:ferredoxin
VHAARPTTEGLVEKFTRWYIGRLSAELSLAGAPLAAAEPPPQTSPPATTAPAAHAAEAVGQFTIQFARSGRSITCGADTFILTAANSAGVRLPCFCTKGMCGTCKSKLLSGTVDMRPNGGIRQSEIDQGMILTCCSRPSSDLVIDR